MSKYEKISQVNWFRLVKWLIPPLLRRNKTVALIRALIIPISDLHTRFVYFRANIIYRLGITPQVCYLEKALNDKWDVDQRRIRIVKGVEFFPIPFFQKEEAKPVKFFQKIEGNEQVFYQQEEIAMFNCDFIIEIPVFVDFDMIELRAYVDSFKRETKTYKVQIV